MVCLPKEIYHVSAVSLDWALRSIPFFSFRSKLLERVQLKSSKSPVTSAMTEPS